jgi:vacuolar-type H+-ATPase subunit E/Vma4
MTRSGRKLWSRGDARAESSEAPDDMRGSDAAASRISAYTVAENAPQDKDDSADARREPEVAEMRSTGEEVDSILAMARETAAKVARGAKDDADRIRSEAKETAASEIEQARRERSDAEEYAARIRGEAEAEAEKLRANAEGEAASMVAAARSRLDGADAEIQRRVRDAEEEARARAESLEAEAERHEERLQRLLVVFRGMSSQLEAVLEGRGENGRPADAVEERLEEALRPETRSEQTS